MITEFTSVDMASRQRYAANLLGFLVESLEESAQELPQVSCEQPDAAQFRIQSASDAIEIEANNPIGCLTLKHIAIGSKSTAPTNSGSVELSECHYPWDCKVTFIGCEWLRLGARDPASTTKPALNEYGRQIAAALMNKLLNPDFEH
jgi:hypothetical protein